MTAVRKFKPKKAVTAGRVMKPLTTMEDLFENFFPRGLMEHFWEPFGAMRTMPELEAFEGRWLPVDLIDREKDVLVRAEIPGVKKEDLELNIVNDRLMIEAKREMRKEEQEETYYRSELATGMLKRMVTLPCEVDVEKISARLKDGVLEVVLPKAEPAVRHEIKIG